MHNIFKAQVQHQGEIHSNEVKYANWLSAYKLIEDRVNLALSVLVWGRRHLHHNKTLLSCVWSSRVFLLLKRLHARAEAFVCPWAYFLIETLSRILTLNVGGKFLIQGFEPVSLIRRFLSLFHFNQFLTKIYYCKVCLFDGSIKPNCVTIGFMTFELVLKKSWTADFLERGRIFSGR